MRVQEKILIAKTQIKTEKIERFRSTIGKYLLLTLLIAYVYTEIETIYAIIAEPNTFSITNPLLVEAQAETGNEASVFTNGVENPPLVGNIEDKIRNTFPECPEIAVAVATCESSLDPLRVGDTHMEKYSYGLFQINRTWNDYPAEVLLDPEQNIKIAKELYDKYGWGNWTCGKILGLDKK